MRILMIFDGDYPWDVRVEKSLRALGARGHEVTLVARNRQGRARIETLDGVTIRRLPRGGALGTLLTFPAFFSPLWAREAWRAAKACRPERIVVRDLPLAPLALRLARRLGVPVIVDMAEPYPEALRSNWQFDRLGGLDHLLRSPWLAELVERRVVRQGPRTLVVSEESGARLERVGLPPGRWTLVGNTPELDRLVLPPRADAIVPEALRGRRILLFSGILVGDRGIEVALRGLARLVRERGPTVGLVVIGEGVARARFEAEARALGLLGHHAVFVGWVPHDELPRWWAGADAGLLPFHACTHIHTTLANKLFDYMASGLPVVASDARPMVRVLEETGAGVTFRAGDDADFAGVVGHLLDSPAEARAMAERGRKAAAETYHWARDAERLAEAVERP
jgi:glycosyltransferase involved in cell wall biosynthesis